MLGTFPSRAYRWPDASAARLWPADAAVDARGRVTGFGRKALFHHRRSAPGWSHQVRGTRNAPACGRRAATRAACAQHGCGARPTCGTSTARERHGLLALHENLSGFVRLADLPGAKIQSFVRAAASRSVGGLWFAVVAIVLLAKNTLFYKVGAGVYVFGWRRPVAGAPRWPAKICQVLSGWPEGVLQKTRSLSGWRRAGAWADCGLLWWEQFHVQKIRCFIRWGSAPTHLVAVARDGRAGCRGVRAGRRRAGGHATARAATGRAGRRASRLKWAIH